MVVTSINGGSGGTVLNDFNDIADITKYPEFGGGDNITSIDIRSVEIRHGSLVDGLKFIYSVVTKDGVSHSYIGNKYGGNGGVLSEFNLLDNEKISVITVTYGKDVDHSPNNNTVVKNIKFQTSKQTKAFGGEVTKGDIELPSLPIGLVFGSTIDNFVGSIGTVEINPPTTTLSTTTLSTSTGICSSSTALNNNASSTSSSGFVALSFTTGILGLYFLVTMGIFLWRKFHNKPMILISGNHS